MDLTRSSLKIFGSKVASAVISFAGITFFARELGASQLGSFFLFQALLGILAIPADFGIRGAVEKRISEGEDPDAVLTTAVLLKFLPLAVIVVGIVLFQGPINEYVGTPIALYLAVALVLQEFAHLMVFVLRGELRVGETALIQLSRQAIWVGVGTAFVLSDGGVRGLVIGLLAGFCMTLLWGAYKMSTGVSTPTKRQARSLVDYSKYNFISSVGGYFYNWMDVVIIGLFLTQADVGAYEITWRVTAVVMLFSQSIATTIFPQVSEWDAAEATERIEQLLPRVLTPTLLFVIPAFFGSILFSQEILSLVFGAEYAGAWLVLIILMGEKLLQAPHAVLGRSLQGIDRPDLAARAGIVAMALNLVLNVVLVWQFGIVGAAVATTVSFAANTFLHGRYLSRFVAIRIPSREIGWCVVASLGMALVLVLARSAIVVDTLAQLAVVVLLGVVAYSAFVLLFRPFRVRVFEYGKTLQSNN